MLIDLRSLWQSPARPGGTTGSWRVVLQPRVPLCPVYGDDGDVLAFTTVVVDDTDGFTAARLNVWPLVTNVQPVQGGDDEQAFLYVDDEFWIRPYQQTFPVSTLVHADPDELWPLGGFRLDDELWLHPGSCPILANQPPLTDTDELNFTAPSISVDEEYWQSPGSTRVPCSTLVWADLDDYGPLGGFRLEEESWAQPTYLPYTVNQQPWLFESDDLAITAAVLGLDEDWYLPGVTSLPANRAPYTDDDTWVPPPTPFFLDEDFWDIPGLRAYRTDIPVVPVVPGVDEGDWVVFVPPPTVFYQGDGDGPKKKKRKRRETDVLFDAIEHTIRETLADSHTRQAVATTVPVVDLSHGYDAALDRLLLAAQDRQDLSARLARLQRDIARHEQRLLDNDEDEWMMF